MILATVKLSQTFAATTAAARVELDQIVLDDPPGRVELDQSFDTAAGLLQPRLQLDDGAGGTLTGVDIVAPSVSPWWLVAGLDPGVIPVGELEVSARLLGGEREWKRAILASTGSRRGADFAFNVLGTEISRGGPPPGEEVEVDFGLDLYDRAAGTSASIPLLTTGYVVSSKRTWSEDGHLLELAGRGPEILYAEREIDMELLPGHGLTHGEIAILAMQAALVPAELIGIDPGIGAAREVGVEISCETLWSVLERVLRPVGYQVLAGIDDGVFRAVRLEPEDDEEPFIVLRAGAGGDLEQAKVFSVEAESARPSCAEVTGVRLEDVAAGPGSGTVTTEVVIETYDPDFVLPTAVASQASGASTITATGVVPGPAKLTLVHRTLIRVTTEDGCEVETYVREQGWYKPQAARYIAATDPDGGSPGVWLYPTFNVYFYDTIPVADDSQEGFLWPVERFVVLSESWTRPQWRADGRRTGTITAKAGWKNPQAAIKSRATAATTWEATNYIAGRYLTASGSGLVFPSEYYFAGPASASSEALAIPGTTYGSPTSIAPITALVSSQVILRYLSYDVETRTISEDDYETAVATDSTAWEVKAGVLYLYTGGTGGSEFEIGLTGTVSEQRSQIAGKPTTIQGGRDSQGQLLDTVVTRGDGRGLPAAEICTEELADETRRQEFTVDVCVTVDDGLGGEVVISSRTLKLSSEFVETQAEAERWGLQELAIARGFPCELSLASPCPVLDVGDVAEVDVAEIGPVFRAKVWERSLRVGGRRDGRVEDVVTLLIRPW